MNLLVFYGQNTNSAATLLTKSDRGNSNVSNQHEGVKSCTTLSAIAMPAVCINVAIKLDLWDLEVQ